jgi:hypothetical protein
MKRLRLILIALFAVVVVASIFFAVYSEQRRMETVASIEAPLEFARHNRLAEVMLRIESEDDYLADGSVRPTLDTVAQWTGLLKRFEEEIEGPEWDSVTDLWLYGDGWESLAPNEQTELHVFLDAHVDFIALLRGVAALGGPVQVYATPVANDDRPTHLSALQDLSWLLRFDTIVRAKTGDMENAVCDAVAAIELFETLAGEPWLIAQWARHRHARVACLAIQSAFDPGVLSNEETGRIVRAVQRTTGHESLLYELKLSQFDIGSSFDDLLAADWSSRHEQMGGVFLGWGRGSIPRRAIIFAYSSPLGRPWLNRDIVQTNELMNHAITVAQLPYHEAIRQFDGGIHGFSPYARLMEAMPVRTMRSQAEHEVQVRLLQIGLTLEQHQRQTGSLPPSLETLSDTLPKETFIDPYTGAAMVYHPGEERFLLYSVGRNLADDGGHPHFGEGDIVWRGTD